VAAYFLTRRAAKDLLHIHEYSAKRWSQTQADTYLEQIIKAIQKAALNPKLGELRRHRVAPFLMISVEKHFAIYKAVKGGIIVATVLHSRRDIETILDQIDFKIANEIERLEKNFAK